MRKKPNKKSSDSYAVRLERDSKVHTALKRTGKTPSEYILTALTNQLLWDGYLPIMNERRGND